MDNENTFFASPERATEAEIKAQVELFSSHPILKVLLESVSSYLLILDSHRQILFANQEILTALNISKGDTYVGMRPGELFCCIHSTEEPAGCGTSKDCQNCAAVLSILSTQSTGQPADGVCHLCLKMNGQVVSHDLKVKTSRLKIGDSEVIVMVLKDITDEKRRQTMEKIFFHDLKNLLGGLNGWTELLKLKSTDTTVHNIANISRRLSEEIQGQYLIGQALGGELQVNLREVPCQKLIDDLKMIFGEHPVTFGKVFQAKDPILELKVTTDPEILERILINMVKNGLEASGPGESVTLWTEKLTDTVRFSVHSTSTISAEAIPHIFEKSFTTTGDPGRGLGCFAIKYLGELYLGGKVGFATGSTEGTVFWIELP